MDRNHSANSADSKELINSLVNAEDEENAVTLAFRVIKQLEDEKDLLTSRLEDSYKEINRLNHVVLSLNQEINQINYQHSNSNVFKRNWSRMKKLLKNLRLSRIKKGFSYLRREGFAATLRRYRASGATNPDPKIAYQNWILNHEPKYADLQNQKRHKFEYSPLISIVVPTYNTKKQYLEEMIASLKAQTYDNWELCIADGNSDNRLEIEEVIKRNPKIKYVMLDENKNISGNTNEALKLCSGEYIGLLDHDDTLAPFCLYEVVKALNEDRSTDIIYSDEDKFTTLSGARFQPHFKPDFSPDYLRSINYITHFFVIKKSLMDELGGFIDEYNGAQDYDLILRATEKSDKIVHIPKVLYHWRVHENSTSMDVGAKQYVIDAGKKAVEAHIKRLDMPGEVTSLDDKSIYRVRFDVDDEEKVSIVIPNKDHVDDLKKCINSILTRSTYSNYEIVVVENNSTHASIFNYYKKLEKNNRIKVIYYEGEFNYSRINNFAIDSCNGKYLLFLNNDTEVITPEWLEEMVMFARRDDVGAVGAKLLYPNNTIQHAGVVVGLGGVAGHVYPGAPRDASGYFHRLRLVNDYGAVTGACLMMKKDDFVNAGGFDEELAVAFNDIDLCVKMLRLGKYNVYTPFCELYHYESKSRGLDLEGEKNIRFQGEVKMAKEKWKDVLSKGDPFYSPNLSLDTGFYEIGR